MAEQLGVPVEPRVDTATFTLNGKRRFTRRATPGLLGMVRREEFDTALCKAAVEAGATIRERTAVRAVDEDGVVLRDGSRIRAGVVIGADGSAGVTARHVGVHCGQVDLGLEVELPVPGPVRNGWRGRVLVDWGPLPGSYGWVFPKDDRLTVGVIAARGNGDATREYLRAFLDRLGLAGLEPAEDSGHLPRRRNPASPPRPRAAQRLCAGLPTRPGVRTATVPAPAGRTWRVRVVWQPRWRALARRYGGWRRKRRGGDLSDLAMGGGGGHSGGGGGWSFD